jgi:hypothetical protein
MKLLLIALLALTELTAAARFVIPIRRPARVRVVVHGRRPVIDLFVAEPVPAAERFNEHVDAGVPGTGNGEGAPRVYTTPMCNGPCPVEGAK